MILSIGDIHGNFNVIIDFQTKCQITDSHFIIAGDCGILDLKQMNHQY